MQSYRFSLLICGSAFRWKFEIKVLWGSAGREILEKMATLKGNYLSFGGIQTLIQAALSSLPVCFDPYSKPQKRWYRNLNHCKENFLWKGRELNKPHLIKMFLDLKKMASWVLGELQIGMWLFWANGIGCFQKNDTLSGLPSFVANVDLAWTVGTSIRFCHLRTIALGKVLSLLSLLFWLSLRPLSTTYITFVLDRHLVWLSISSVSFLSVVQPFVKENKSHFRFCLYFSRVGYPPSKEP